MLLRLLLLLRLLSKLVLLLLRLLSPLLLRLLLLSAVVIDLLSIGRLADRCLCVLGWRSLAHELRGSPWREVRRTLRARRAKRRQAG